MRRSLLLCTAALVPTAAPAQETINYSYDAKGRLTKAAHSGSVNDGVASEYRYDRADNRERRTVTGVPTSTPTPSPTPTPIPSAPVYTADRSFEEPAVGGWFQYNPGVAGANFDGGAGVAGNGSPWGFDPAPADAQVGFLQSRSDKAAYIGLVVDGLVVGRPYAVRFKMAQRPGWNPDQVHVTMQNQSLGFHSPASKAFQQVVTGWFTATSTVGTLGFAGTVDASNLTVALDDISFIQGAALANASFEQPGLGAGFQYNPTGDGNTYEGGSGIAGNGSAWAFQAAPGGTQVAFLQNSSAVISMPVSGLTPGARYRVRFHAAKRPYFPANTVQVSFSGTSLGSHTPAGEAFQQVATAEFQPSASTGVLRFAGVTPGDSGTGIDAVSVVPIP